MNTCAPRGTVLSPFLFTLYTADGRSSDESCPLTKFADDTAQVGMIKGSDDSVYKKEVENFVNWCEENYLELNATKTKEIVIDFRKTKGTSPEKVTIKGLEVDRVETHKYLGVVFDEKLSFSGNTEAVIKKANSRLYCLRKLRSFNVQSDILSSFYRAAISSVLTFGVVCWGGSITDRDKARLDKIMTKAGQVTGQRQKTFDEEYETRLLAKATRIDRDLTHPFATEFTLRRIERSGRLRQPKCKTKRYEDSFIPQGVTALNKCFK